MRIRRIDENVGRAKENIVETKGKDDFYSIFNIRLREKQDLITTRKYSLLDVSNELIIYAKYV